MSDRGIKIRVVMACWIGMECEVSMRIHQGATIGCRRRDEVPSNRANTIACWSRARQQLHSLSMVSSKSGESIPAACNLRPLLIGGIYADRWMSGFASFECREKVSKVTIVK